MATALDAIANNNVKSSTLASGSGDLSHMSSDNESDPLCPSREGHELPDAFLGETSSIDTVMEATTAQEIRSSENEPEKTKILTFCEDSEGDDEHRTGDEAPLKLFLAVSGSHEYLVDYPTSVEEDLTAIVNDNLDPATDESLTDLDMDQMPSTGVKSLSKETLHSLEMDEDDVDFYGGHHLLSRRMITARAGRVQHWKTKSLRFAAQVRN